VHRHLTARLLVLLAFGCSPDDTALPPGLTPSLRLEGTPRPHGIEWSIDQAPPSSRLVCEAPGVDGERHEAVDPFDADLRFSLLGLLADTEYHCTLLQPAEATTADEADAVAEVGPLRTPPRAIPAPWSVTDHVPERRSGAYTLFNLGDANHDDEAHLLVMVDPEGRVRWVHVIDRTSFDCDARYLDDGTVLYGGGQGIVPTVVALDGEVLWTAPERAEAERYHHHTERLDDGTVLALRHTREVPPEGEGEVGQSWRGVRIEHIAPDGTTPWSWESQRAVDDGWLPVPGANASDPWHANSARVLDDVTYLNLRQPSLLLAIAADGAVQWRLGPRGDFTLLDADGRPLSDEHWFHAAHDPEPHADADGTLRVLFHDNGYGRDTAPPYSQVLELVVDPVARTATRTWTWTEPGWYEPVWGDADELPDGGVLVARGHCRTCGNGTSEIIEVDRPSGDVDWRLRFTGDPQSLYRAQRIDGCAIFHHVGYCPDR
jgi:hypothetical protein